MNKGETWLKMKFSEILGIVGSGNNQVVQSSHPRKVTSSASVSGASTSRVNNFGRSRKHSGGVVGGGGSGGVSELELVRLGYVSDSNMTHNNRPVVTTFRKVRKRSQSHIEDVDDYSNFNCTLEEENLYYQADSEGGLGPSSSGMSRSSNSNLQSSAPPTGRRQMFLDIVRQSNVACQNGDFPAAVALYSEALKIDPSNHILHSNRSAALIKMGQFVRALQDAMKAKELNPKWSKAYYRQGVALQCLGKHSDALAAFSAGLAEDPKSSQLLSGLIEAATKSPLKAKLEPTFEQLASMKLAKSPFVVISVIGQELLASSQYIAAVVVLESALRIGTTNSKLKGSVYSALSSAFWALNSLDKAIGYMQQDLNVAKSLGDVQGECRAHGNLGSAYFSQSNFKDALTSHRYQLVLAMKCKDTQAAASALTSLGHVYTAIGDGDNALASHKQCVQLVKQMGDSLQEAREIGNVGAVYLVMGDFDNAIDCHTEHLRIAKQLGNKVEEARAYTNLGSSYHYRRNFEQAITFHNQVLKIAQETGDKNIEARAYAGLGHAARCMGDYTIAKMWHAKQLDMALATKDKVNEGRACSNLGIVFQLLGDHDAALKLHQSHLNIALALHDRAGMGRAYGNIGNAYNAMGYYDQAIKYHKQELAISKEVNDKSSEASTHGNLAVGYQALGMCENITKKESSRLLGLALVHYHSHLNISRELKDTSGEACALLNLGNCHSSLGDFGQAIPFYETYLMLSQELNDIEGEAKACHFLGFAHYSLGHFKEAVRYYNQDLCLAKELQNTANISRAYCNLGLTHLCVGNLEEALECQKYFLAVTHSTKDVAGKYRALGNIGNIMLTMKKPEEAVKVFQKQVLLAKSNSDKCLEASAYSALGSAHRILKRFDLSLGFHTQELTILQEVGDTKGECRAHGNLGSVHMALGNYTSAIKCYEEMLERAKELKDSMTEAQAYGNLGISRINMGNYEEAATFFELQLSVLESLSSSSSAKITSLISVEKGRAYGNLGECCSTLGDHEKAIRCHEKSLQMSIKTNNLREQEKTYRPLGLACKSLGNTTAALAYFEKRLEIIHQLSSECSKGESSGSGGSGVVDEEILKLKATALSDLGQEYLDMRNFEAAVHCFQQQLNIATKEIEDKELEAEAVSLLGRAYQVMGKYAESLQYHEIDLGISQELNNVGSKARAYGNIGLVHESMGNFEDALLYQEHHLNAATQMNNAMAKSVAFSSIGRIHHALGNNIQAVAYLQQGLQLVETLDAKEEEAKIRHFLGLAYWRHGELESAQAHLEKSSDLLETIRQNTYGSGSEYSLALFDQQIASYQALQRILVQMGRTDLALLFAEKSRTLANSTLLSNKGEFVGNGKISGDPLAMATLSSSLINSVDALIQRVNRHRVAVLYFSSLAGGYLYSWLLIPDRGIVKFNESCINNDEDEDRVTNMGTLLEHYIEGTRDALGIDFNVSGSTRNLCVGESEGEGQADLWSQHLEELGDKINQDNDKTGFLRMVSRNHRFNCSSYSLSSLFSVGSATGSVKSASTSRPGSTRSHRSSWQGPSCLRSLYQMLIAPFEEELNVLDQICFKELVLVLDTDLLLVPFPILRSCTNEEYLCEKFKIILAPSISSIRSGGRCKSKNETSIPLVVGNPCLSAAITDQWGWEDIPRAQNEANMISEILQCQPLTGAKATKESVVNEMFNAEVIHLATTISWKLSAIVLSPGGARSRSNNTSSDTVNNVNSSSKCDGNSSDGNSGEGNGDLPPFSDYLLTAADILKLRLNAKLVVLSSCHTKDKMGLANGDSVIALTKALLASGAMSVLVTLWPVPETASKIFFRALYSSLLQGSKVSHALTEAMLTVQHTKHFAHPANWAGYLLLGSDVQLSNKVALTSQAMWELMKSPERSRDALRVSLHLVEKSLQRINNGQKNAMYTTQKSIENKVGNATGWKDILMSVGFRFEPASNGLPAAVFFPQCDPGEKLGKCSANLQALLGLSPQSVNALSKLLSTPEAGEEVISILRQAIAELASKNLEVEKVEVKINVKLWGIVGCHELLASLGFDLIEVGENEVIVGIGKHVTMRMLQLALQATLALFETHESNDHQGSFERSLSLESLELGTEELCEIANVHTARQGPAYLPARQPIAMGKGAFTSYVRSRGEPDGHTNSSSEQAKQRDLLELKFSNLSSTNMLPQIPSGRPRPPLPALRNQTNSLVNRTYQNIAVERADSSSSGSSMADWENGLTTVRRRAPPIPGNPPDAFFNVGGGQHSLAAAISAFDSQGSDPEFIMPTIPPTRKTGRFIQHTNKPTSSNSASTAGKRVTWKMNEIAAAANANKMQTINTSSTVNTELKPWMVPRSTFVIQKEKDVPHPPGRSNNLHEHLMKSSPRDLPLSDVYQERNVGLGLAPSLSKLLLSNRLSLGPIESSSGNKSDTEGGNMSVDDTMSTFDQLSLADDSAPESTPPIKTSIPTRKGISSKRLLNKGRTHPKNGGPFVTTAEISPISLNLTELVHDDMSGSSTSSSKSSPSDLSKERDEGDGRSLTDSQYGSYSPSMAQNDLIVQTAAAVYFASKGNNNNGTSCEIQGSKLPPSNCDKNSSQNRDALKTENNSVTMPTRNQESSICLSVDSYVSNSPADKGSRDIVGKRSSKSSSDRNNKNKLSIQLNSFSSNQKSSQC